MFRDVPECPGMFPVPGFIDAPEIFRSNDPKCHVPFTFQPDFPESFSKR